MENISLQSILFYVFSSLAVIGAISVIIAKNPVRAVLSLVFTIVCMAAIWLLLESEFLAIVLVLVYVGAVMVLFLFVVMMIDNEIGRLKANLVKHWPLGALFAGVMFGILALAVGHKHFGAEHSAIPPALQGDFSSVKVLGELLYSEYLLAFEIAGVILLVAMVAAIGLTFRGPRAKTQIPGKQIQVLKRDRLKIIKMASETQG